MLKKTSDDKPRKQFRERDTDESSYKERSEQSTGTIGDSIFQKGFDVYRAKQGENCIRILPRTWEEPKHYGYDVYVHAFVGVNRGSYLCLAQMKNKRCPICEIANEMQARGEEQEAYKVKAKRRVVYWVIDRNVERGKSTWPMLFNASPTMDRDIAACTRSKRGQVYIHRVADGRDVVFKRKGTTVTNTEYFGYQLDPEPTPVHEDRKLQQQMLNFIEENPVPSCLLFQKPEYLQQVMAGTAEEEDPDLDTTEESSEDEEAQEYAEQKRAKKAKAKAPAADEEDEDEEEAPWQGKGEDSDDEDYQDESGEDQDDEDQDDEDQDDSDDEEDDADREAPARGSAKRGAAPQPQRVALSKNRR